MKEVIEMTETMVNGVKFKVWSDFIARRTFAENEDGDARIIKSAGYISNDLTIRKAIALAYNLPTFRKNAKKAVAENATATAESDTEVEQNVETAEQIQAYEQKTEFKKEVITMINTIERISYNMAERERLHTELEAAEAELKAYSREVDCILEKLAETATDEEYDAKETELTYHEDVLREIRAKCWLRAFAAQFPKTRNEWFTSVIDKLVEEGKADGEEHHITAKQYDCFSRYCRDDKDTWRERKTYCRVGKYFITIRLLKYGKGSGTIKIVDLT